jgi:hypothetical protein
MMIVGVALAGIFTGAVATYFLSGHDDTTHSTNVDSEVLPVVQELAAMKASMDTLQTELNQVRSMLSEFTESHRDSPLKSERFSLSAEPKAERSEDVIS